MASGKLYIGRKVREIRDQQAETQAVFAQRLGISTSYLNQIENNQRPVSATVLVALAEKFNVDIGSISAADSDRLLSALTEALADPVFDKIAPGLQELKLITQNAPGFAHALLRCHQAFRRNSEQLASFDEQMGRPNTSIEPTPYEEVRDFFHFVDNYIHDLDLAAEQRAIALGLPNQTPHSALAGHLEQAHGVRVLPDEAGSDRLRHFDPGTRILRLNTRTPAPTRAFQMAYQIGALEAGTLLDQILTSAKFRTAEATQICRIGLMNYYAGALVLPYQQFRDAAELLRHDLELLATQFDASLEQLAHRLSTLQRPGHKGVPVFFARIDRAGNITKRHSATALQFARYGAACPLWNAHSAFETPGRIIRQLAETPDGARYLCVATETDKGGGGFLAPHRRYAIALGCEVSHADRFVYADGLEITNKAVFDAIGISCRICERTNCPQRAFPPLKSTLAIDQNSRDILPYSLA